MLNNSKAVAEQRALKFSLYGVVFFIVLALSFALLTKSNAILFDGVFSLISFSMTLLTLKVAQLVQRPDDDLFHFGYTALEPTLNLFKSLIIVIICIVAVIGAVNQLLAGGNHTEYGLAVIYGVFASVGCFIVTWLMHRSAENVHSDLVRVESKSWFVDGLLSASVLIGFVAAWFLQHSDWAEYAPLVDPALLILLVVLTIPIPGKIFLDSLKEVVDMAPSNLLVDEIEKQLLYTLKDVKKKQVILRVSKRGRCTYLLVHVVVSNDFILNCVDDLDRIRESSENSLRRWKPELEMDMLFVSDPKFS